VSRRVQEDTRDKLDVGFQDMGNKQLKNIANPVWVYAVRLDAKRADGPLLLDLPDKPSIAVLPFDNLSSDREHEYFADGIVAEIITDCLASNGCSSFREIRHSSTRASRLT
jgi:adenylate cyclase